MHIQVNDGLDNIPYAWQDKEWHIYVWVTNIVMHIKVNDGAYNIPHAWKNKELQSNACLAFRTMEIPL